MKKLLVSGGIVLLILILGISCDDIFEQDISDDTVAVITPQENVVLKDTLVTFAWDSLKGADEYRFILVRPSFDDIQSYLCDSLTEERLLRFSLDSGKYQWSIQGINFAYNSLIQKHSFQVQY